ncbi:MAG TPA: LEA type 2 family protein [Polyangiaceae bacterium]
MSPPYEVSSTMRSLLPLAAAAALLAGCSKAAPSPPTLTPEHVTVNAVDPTGMTLTVTVNAENPNSSDLTAKDVSSHVVVSGHDVGTVTVAQSITLPAGKTTQIDAPFKVSWSDVTMLAQLAATNAPVPYSVDGTLELGGSMLHVGVPFHLDGSLTHEQILGAVVRSMQMPMHPR